MNALNYTTVCQLFVLHRNTRYHMTKGKTLMKLVQSAGAAEYTDCISVEG